VNVEHIAAHLAFLLCSVARATIANSTAADCC